MRPYQKLNALQTVGYKEIFEHLEGKISLQESIRQIKLNTKQYAKRQVTWFKKEKSIYRMTPQAGELKIFPDILLSKIDDILTSLDVL